MICASSCGDPGLPDHARLVVPPIVLALAKHPLVDEFDLSSLEFMSGAAPLSAELEVACGKRLGCRISRATG